MSLFNHEKAHKPVNIKLGVQLSEFKILISKCAGSALLETNVAAMHDQDKQPRCSQCTEPERAPESIIISFSSTKCCEKQIG